MKNLLLLVVFFMVLQGGFAQSQQPSAVVDSLLDELQHASSELEKAKINYNIGLEYLHTNKKKCMHYFNKAEELLKKTKEEDELFINLSFSKGFLYCSLNDYKSSDSLYDLAIYYSNKFCIDTLYHHINSLNGKALNLFYKGEYDKSLSLYSVLDKKLENLDTSIVKNKGIFYSSNNDRAIVLANMGKISEALVFFKANMAYKQKMYSPDDILTVATLITSINNVALCYDMLNHPKIAIEYYFKSLEIAKKHNMTNHINMLYLNLSKLFLNQADFEKCIKYGLLAIGSNSRYNFGSYNNIGLAYMNMNEIQKSNDYFFKALNECDKLNRPDKECSINLNIGLNYIKMSKPDSAILFLNRAKDINIKIKDETSSLKINIAFGKYFAKVGNYEKSVAFFLKADSEAGSLEALGKDQLRISEGLYKVYKTTNNYKQSLHWLEVKSKINTELDSLRNVEAVNELETKYQSQQKENQILKLSNENIQKEAQLAQAKFTSYGIFGVLLLILGLGYLLWFRQKQKQKLALLKSTVTASEAEKNRLGRELHDGIAGRILKIVYDTENNQTELSNTLLEIYNQVRHLSHQLDGTPVHGELFFDRLLEVIPEDNEKQTFNLTLLPNNMILQEPVGSSVYRIIQELITNNLKHAKADKTDIKIVVNDNRLVINYSDNGIGTNNFNKGNGFHNIEDRVTLLKGSVKINTHSAEGFQVEIVIPYMFDAK